MSKNEELLNLLRGNKLFKEEDLQNFINCKTTLNEGLNVYRKELLKNIKIRDDDIELTKTNIEKIFLNPLTIMEFNYIRQAIKLNKWTIKDLFEKCQQLDMNVMIVVGVRNERADF